MLRENNEGCDTQCDNGGDANGDEDVPERRALPLVGPDLLLTA